MKLLLLRVLLQKRARDEGFTLPMVIALGLVMILLGTTNIVKSSEENLNATIQNSSSDALAVAEVGVTKYRELLNRNRFLTVQNYQRWSDATNFPWIATQTCDVITTTPNGWNDGGTAATPNDTSKWWRIEEDLDNDPITPNDLIGEYQLVSYIYDIDNNTSDSNDNNKFAQNDDRVNLTDDFTYNNNNNYNPRGLLTVKGRSPDGSEAQIEVEIPLRINQDDLNNLAPALWINNRGNYLNSLSSNLGSNLTLPAGNNIVLSTAASSSGCTDPPDIGSNNVVGDPRRVPNVNYVKNTLIPNATAASRIQTDTDLLDSATGDNRIGRTGHDAYKEPINGGTFSADDCSNINDCRYYYNLGTSPITLDEDTYTDGIAKATLYIDSDLTIDEVDVGSSVSSSYFEIYVNGNRTITIDTGAAGNTIEIDAFIHAPSARLDITGSGNVIFRGSLWVNRLFNSTTGTVTIDVDNTRSDSRNSYKSYNYYTTAIRRTPRPLTSAPTNWTREEVQ